MKLNINQINLNIGSNKEISKILNPIKGEIKGLSMPLQSAGSHGEVDKHDEKGEINEKC